MDEHSITEILTKSFQTEFLKVENDSAKHQRHKQSQGKGGHFKLVIVSNDFLGMDLISRHRKIYQALGMHDQTLIHALSISSWTVDEWQQKKSV